VRLDKRFLELRFPAAGHDDLSASGNDAVGGRQHEVNALLMNKAGDEAKERSARQRKAKLLPHAIGVCTLRLPVARTERPRQLRADFRIPALVYAVQDSGELRGVGAAAKQALKAAAESRCRDLPGIGLADGRQVRGVDDAPLEERQLVVEFEAVDVE